MVHGPRGYPEDRRDLRICLGFGHPPEHLGLAGSEAKGLQRDWIKASRRLTQHEQRLLGVSQESDAQRSDFTADNERLTAAIWPVRREPPDKR
jgi:hypothetical protein